MPALTFARGFRAWGGVGFVPSASGSVVATAVPSTGRVTIAVTWTGASYFNVYRVQGEALPVAVRGAYPIGGSGGATFSDVEAPMDVPVYYTVTTPAYPYQTLTSNTVTLVSSGSTWLTHPALPALATRVVVERNPQKRRPIDRALYKVIGRSRPVAVVAGPRGAAEYVLDVFTETQAERDNMLSLLDDGSPLLLRTPADYGFDAQTWLSVDSVEEVPIVGSVLEWARRWPLSCVEVDPPSVLDAVAVY
jgi:hypothetical protein